VIEVDGFAYHWSPEAKAYDEARRNRLRLGGSFLLVYSWRDICFDGRRVAQEALVALRRFADGATVPVTGAHRAR
jgi:very-short-patch-repair endonuclease